MIAAVSIAAAVFGGCGDSGTLTGGSPATGGNSSGSAGAPSTGGDPFGSGGGIPSEQVIVISPQTFELTIIDGAVVTQALTATIQGQDVTSQVQWSFEKPNVGDVSAALFTPTGIVGGSGKVTATLGIASGQADGTVYIEKTVGAGLVTPAQKAALDNPQGGADPSMSLIYPFNETVFPLDVLAPEMMWNGSNVGDAFKLTITEQFYEYTEYFATAPPGRHLIAEADWASIGSSGAGANADPVAVALTRATGNTAYSPATSTWHIAQGKLKGAIYYWELPDACGEGNGRVLKIKPNDPVPEQFYTPGGCWGCHTVSRDGAKMMANLSGGSPFAQVTIDLTQTPAVQGSIGPGVSGGTFSAFNDTGDRIAVSTDGGSVGDMIRIIDGNTGAELNPNAMGTGCGEPAWSPDGTKLAAICGSSNGGQWFFDEMTGYLTMADVAADGFTVTNQQTIVPQAGGQGRPAYPSFSPGSEWIAFGRPTQGSRSIGNGDLWITDQTGANVKQLTTASTGNQSFNPVFAPLRAGGYYWLVYISRRDYGNRLVGANRQQLWITAIDDPPTAADPSHPPFYVRGQEDCGKSENAYMALEPCKQLGESCTSGVDCCEGTCVKDPNTMEYVCGVPGECAQDGNACEVAADCCNAPTSQCVDGYCEPPVPQ